MIELEGIQKIYDLGAVKIPALKRADLAITKDKHVEFKTERGITAYDHASVQIEIADVDEHGRIKGTKRTVALAGHMRQRGESDACLNRLFGEMGLISFKK